MADKRLFDKAQEELESLPLAATVSLPPISGNVGGDGTVGTTYASTSGSTTVLGDFIGAFTVNEHVGKWATFIEGANQWVAREVVSNTTDAVTVSPAFPFSPSMGDDFTLTTDQLPKHLDALTVDALGEEGGGSTATVCWIKVAGVWKTATPHLKVSGVWKTSTPFIKISGVWK